MFPLVDVYYSIHWQVGCQKASTLITSMEPIHDRHVVTDLMAHGHHVSRTHWYNVGRTPAVPSHQGVGHQWYSKKRVSGHTSRCNRFAERQGFEPWVPVRAQRFSRPPRSTTPASFLVVVKMYDKVTHFFLFSLILANKIEWFSLSLENKNQSYLRKIWTVEKNLLNLHCKSVGVRNKHASIAQLVRASDC